MNNLHRDLIEESTSEFRDQLLRTTLATSRRARRIRVIAKSCTAFYILFLAALIIFPRHRAPKSVALSTSASSASSAVNENASRPPAYTIIHTEPFTAVLHTTPLRAENLITATASGIKILDTSQKPAITSINDDQLLALFAGQPVALLAGSRGQELIFLETEAPISN